MSNVIAEKAVKFAEIANAALAQAGKLTQSLRAERREALAKVAGVRDKLAAKKIIDAHEKRAADIQLGVHADALDIISSLVDHYETKLAQVNQKQAAQNLGSPVDDASKRKIDKYANYAGYRRGYDDPLAESDLALFRGLGITPRVQ